MTGKHAHFFAQTLGFALDEIDEIERQLLGQLPRVPAHRGRLNPTGRRNWLAIVVLKGPRATRDTFTVWQMTAEERPELVTARAARSDDRLRYGL